MPKQKSLATQEIISVDHIKDDVVVLKNGGFRKILLVSGINFDLKSEEEKNLIIFSYQEFLNSLSFSIQEIIHSRKINIDNYLNQLKKLHQKEPTSLLKNIITDYRDFVKAFVERNPIMSKTFFIIVPYDPIALPKIGKKIAGGLFGLFKKKKAEEEKTENDQFIENKRQLDLRVDQVTAGLNRVGLRAVPLSEDEVVELFYNFYNPALIEKKGVSIQKNK
jgi:type IV secretory pathway VirB4 component